MTQIEIINVDSRRKIELGEAPLTIGRSRICQCRVNDKSLSREHMEIRKKADGHWVKDLGSRNRTFVNGLKVEGEMQLRAGDRITAGRTLILFDPTPEQSSAARPVGTAPAKPAAPAAETPAAGTPAAGASAKPASPPLAPGEWAASPPPVAKSPGEGTAPLAKLAASPAAPAAEAAATAPGWKTGLIVAVVLLGSFIAALVIWLLVFGNG